MDHSLETIDCACVIHGDAYGWNYVERLHSMLQRHLTPQVRLHVYTEFHRPVPDHMVKHALTDWGISGPKQSWWYKIQMFDPRQHSGPLLYFDLDTVIVKNIDWIWQQNLTYFWAPKDFKYLWSSGHMGVNSSVMWWDTQKYSFVWDNFNCNNMTQNLKYRGDQDYISDIIHSKMRRFLDTDQVQSWRWQCLDGGYDFTRKRHRTPGTGTTLLETTSVLVFHGKPKPDQVQDPIIVKHWI
jgi:hypothetical protein